MISLITFCSADMTRAADLCVRSAREHGADSTLIWTQDALKQTAFYRENQALLDQPRGAGLWSWKPWIILQLMLGRVSSEQWVGQGVQISQDGDVIAYSDAGIEFIDNLKFIVDRMRPGEDVWAYANEHLHRRWCKRDVVEHVWPFRPDGWWGEWEDEKAWARFGCQAQASVIFFRVSDYTRAFVAEWLKWCIFEGGRLIDDTPSRAANHKEFIEHRHDQSLLSTMLSREQIPMHGWHVRYLAYEPPRVGGQPENADLPVLYLHHRLRNDQWGEYETRTQCR